MALEPIGDAAKRVVHDIELVEAASAEQCGTDQRPTFSYTSNAAAGGPFTAGEFQALQGHATTPGWFEPRHLPGVTRALVLRGLLVEVAREDRYAPPAWAVTRAGQAILDEDTSRRAAIDAVAACQSEIRAKLPARHKAFDAVMADLTRALSALEEAAPDYTAIMTNDGRQEAAE
jgi:hypothetical protein